MSREIKFRGWDKYDKKMIYDLCQIDSFWHYYSYSNNTGLHFGKTGPDGVSEDFKNKYIMQYTGLKDKNSKEIYEGDILKERTPSGFNYSVVKFGEINISGFSCDPKMCTCFYHDFSNFNDNWGEVALGNNLKNIEVIGNIYENPELLETEL